MKSTPPLRPVVCTLVGFLATSISACAFGPKTHDLRLDEGRAPQTFVYVGTSAASIEVLTVAAGGALSARTRLPVGATASQLAAAPNGRSLIGLDDKGGTVSAYAVRPDDGALVIMGRLASGGSKPGRATVDRTGKYVLVTHQASASVSVLAIGPTGKLLPPDLFPAGPGAFGLALHPSNTVAFVANTKEGTLGQMTFNEGTGTLTAKPGAAIGMPWGSGPRLVACHPGGRWVYVLNETNNTISVHSFDDRMGTVSRLAFQVLAATSSDLAAAKVRARELVVGTTGRAIYVLDVGNDDLNSFGVDEETGGLTLIDHKPSGGTGAAALAIDPSGQYLVVVHSGSGHVASFQLDPKRGAPTLVDSTRANSPPLSVAIVKPPVN